MAKYKTTVTHLEMMPPFLPAAPDVGWPDGLSFAREMDISSPLIARFMMMSGGNGTGSTGAC